MLKEILRVPPDIFISRLASELAKYKEIQPPPESIFWKTVAGKRTPPVQDNWWYIRAAAILRKVALKAPIGVSRLRKEFGYAKRRGVRPRRFQKAAGKPIRLILQQLEAAGLLRKEYSVRNDRKVIKGRVLSYEGIRLLVDLARELGGA